MFYASAGGVIMRIDKIHFNKENENVISYLVANRGGTNRAERERMKRILFRAIKNELTDRQRDCIVMYYLDGMKMKDIAQALHLSKSTVTRHIQSATRKLRKIASYYSN